MRGRNHINILKKDFKFPVDLTYTSHAKLIMCHYTITSRWVITVNDSNNIPY